MMEKDTFMTNIHLDSFFQEKVDSIMLYVAEDHPLPSVPGDCAAGSHFAESLADQSGTFRGEKISVRRWKADC